MSLVRFNFESQYLGNNTEVSIILPDKPRDVDAKDYYKRDKKYKVLWLLHGTYGDHSDWQRKSMIEIRAREKDLICVMPSGLNANYSNWPNFMTGYNMFDYLTEELMPLIHNWFPASSKREDNFICGLSMGGGGAIKYAANHPEKFAAAAILSSAPQNVRETMKNPNQRDANSLANAGGYDAYVNSYENVWDILGELAGQNVLPKLFFACGTADTLCWDRYVKFKEYSKQIGLDATFQEVEGLGHEWRLWDPIMEQVFTFFGLGDAELGKLF